MNVIPQGRGAQVEFATVHVEAWGVDPGAIGLTPGAVDEIAALALAAREARAAARLAADAARGATLLAESALAALDDRVRGAVRSIKTFALSSDSPERVLGLAQIRVPANLLSNPRTPLDPPQRADNVSFDLRSDGAITITWTSRRASVGEGAYFVVRRRLDGEADFSDVGIAPGSTRRSRTISFVDATIPMGATGASYVIEGRRGHAKGEATVALGVRFGGASGNGVAASLKAAA